MARSIYLWPKVGQWEIGYEEKQEYKGSCYHVMNSVYCATFQEALKDIREAAENEPEKYNGQVILQKFAYGPVVHTFSIFDDTEVIALILSLTDQY